MAVCLFVVVVSNVQAQNTANVALNLSMTVDKYIETTPGPLSWNLGTTVHSSNGEQIYGVVNEWDIAYANCPFSVTITGNNVANEGVPRFARAEIGANGAPNGRYDVLPTLYAINFTTNGNRDLFYGTWLQGAHQFPRTKNFAETPHNGQIKMDMKVYVNATVASEIVPRRRTIIDPNMTPEQSADAGNYEATMDITFTAL